MINFIIGLLIGSIITTFAVTWALNRYMDKQEGYND